MEPGALLMELFLSKLLPLWLYPLGLAILLVLLAALGALFRLRLGSALLLLMAGGGLWAASTPKVANLLLATLEADYPELRVETLPKVEAIVLLGGAVMPPRPPRHYADFGMATDRVIHAWRLFQADRAPLILVSGGLLPWNNAERSEAEEIAAFLVAWGVPAERILVEKGSRNTRDNAVFSKALLDEREITDVLLVTSASHMRRAQATFARVGIEAVPAATDQQAVTQSEQTLLDWMPDAEALFMTTVALKEYLGWYYYRGKGWL